MILKRIRTHLKKRELYRRPFYRAYPHAGTITIFDADRKAYADPDQRFFYNAIAKAGHSTVLANLAELKLGHAIDDETAKSGTFIRPSELTESHMREFDNYFKFSIVRNPFTRILSAYLDKIVHGSRGQMRPEGLRFPETGAAPSFADFCAYLENGHLHDHYHFAPQTSVLLLPLAAFDFIGKLESLGPDLAFIRARLANVPADAPIRNQDTHRTGSNEKIREYYTEELASRVGRLYREDFVALGYAPEMDSL